MLLTNYLLTVSHLGSALYITLINVITLLLLDITLDITWKSERINGCCLQSSACLCFCFCCFCVLCRFGEKRCIYNNNDTI